METEIGISLPDRGGLIPIFFRGVSLAHRSPLLGEPGAFGRICIWRNK